MSTYGGTQNAKQMKRGDEKSWLKEIIYMIMCKSFDATK